MAEVITRPKIEIDPDILAEIETRVNEAGQVVIHFLYVNRTLFLSKIRIWKTSYLYPKQSPHRCNLIFTENICYAPEWQEVLPLTHSYFTLIFEGLPASCHMFDFVEDCKSEGGAFTVKNIPRNNEDVYYIRMG